MPFSIIEPAMAKPNYAPLGLQRVFAFPAASPQAIALRRFAAEGVWLP
jgi:hypothetical protein